MDNVILDVLIGLVLVYATLAVLVTSIQEFLAGNLSNSRVNIMHRLLLEGVGQDAEMKKRVLANPLIFALSEGRAARPGEVFQTGPSAVPPDLFARALLMEVDSTGDHKPPSETHRDPQAFVDALVARGLDKPAAPEHRIVGALRGLVVGHETDWPGFEAAIATWFAHIGDRSQGWFKRRSTRWTFCIAIVITVALNADSMHIARALSSDGELRTGLAQLAERVVAQREAGAGGAPATARSTEPARPEVQASARLVDAYNRLRPLYFQDDAIGNFSHRLTSVNDACDIAFSPDAKGTQPGPRTARVPRAASAAEAVAALERSSKLKQKFVSDAEAWIEVLPSLLPQIEKAIAGYDGDERACRGDGATPGGEADPACESSAAAMARSTRAPAYTLRRAHQCLIHVSAWVRAATTASNLPATQIAMREAAVALEESKSALLALVQQQGAPVALTRLFLIAPSELKACAADTSHRSAEAVRRCASEKLDVVTRLPLGLTDHNLLQQFCRVESARTAAELVATDPGLFGLCRQRLDDRPGIGLPAMALTSRERALPSWVSGILVTTMFVLLGAPFWFDLLSKVVKVRSSGRSRDEQDNIRKGAGAQPVAPSGADKGAAGPSAPGAAAPSDPSLNGFEGTLTRREIIALQQRLDVMPASGEFDLNTRLAVRKAQFDAGLGDSSQITPASYLALVGRPAAGSQTLVLGAVGRPRLRQPHPQAQALASNLMAMLAFGGRIPAAESTYSDDLRALGVLFRYKNDPNASLVDRSVFRLALDKPAVLDELDEALVNEILSSRTRLPAWDRDTQPWLDWALGELGQVEANADNRKASNPRICTYLDSVALGEQGDKTPWCGAFVAWVVEQHNALLPPGAIALPAPPAQAASAAQWLQWGTTAAAPARGDVVVVQSSASGSGHHVGWCFDADARHVWLLGGNQSTGGRVCLSKFPIATLLGARR